MQHLAILELGSHRHAKDMHLCIYLVMLQVYDIPRILYQ